MQSTRNLRCFAAAVLFGASVWSHCAPQQPGRVIRICGHGHPGKDYILTLVKAWQTEFQKIHPDIQFQDDLHGDASAIGGLYTNTADLAILDREASFIEVDAYQQGAGHDPFHIPVTRGSVSLAHHAPALVVYVDPRNPLSGLTLQQIDGIFDADHRLGDRSYSNWGDLGLSGEWADKPIHLYTYFLQSAQMQFFERAAMKGSQKFNCCLTVFYPKPGAAVAQQVIAAMSQDKYGLAVLSEPAPDLKPVPLSSGTDSKPVLASADTVSSEAYSLGRTVYIYANRKPGSPLPPAIAEFLAFVVSPQGQAVVARTGGYLPLSDTAVKNAKELLR